MKLFPLYELIVNGERQFLTLSQAGRAYDFGFAKVDFGTFVIDADGTCHAMTDDEKLQVSKFADEHSASK